MFFFDEWWWFSIFQVFPNDLSILLIMVLFNCSFASQGLASCWLWRPLMFAVVQRFYLAFWRFASFFFFPCSFNKGAVSRFLLLHLFCACFCYTLFCESGSWSCNKECFFFFSGVPSTIFNLIDHDDMNHNALQRFICFFRFASSFYIFHIMSMQKANAYYCTLFCLCLWSRLYIYIYHW